MAKHNELNETLTAVSLLLDVESCSRISGSGVYKRWKKGDIEGEPNRVETVEFMVNNELDSWSETHRSIGETRRYSTDSGQELVDRSGALINPRPPSGFNHWPLLIKMLRPARFGIWGRRGDKWRMTGADSSDLGFLTHFVQDNSAATAELFIDRYFSLPVRWTEVHPLGSSGAAKREVEITAFHVPDTWKERVGMDASGDGAFDASFVSGDSITTKY